MNAFTSENSRAGMRIKLWRGERMCLIGMDVDDPTPDMVGFAIETKAPGKADFVPLNNRLAFSYKQPLSQAVTGNRWYPSLEAPFQKFRWIHFPDNPSGSYTYRVTQMHMPMDDKPVKGTSLTADIALDPVVYDDFLDLGFTRNFASSQAYADRYDNNPDIIPPKAAQGLKFRKVSGDAYEWLGFEAYQLIFNLLKEVKSDRQASLDVFAYDLNEPDIVLCLEELGSRLRIVIDNSGDHAPSTSAESQAARRLAASAGSDNVKRMKFIKLQHNKVFVVKKGGRPTKVLFGSTNFSFRGLYIQANNALVVYATEAASLFEKVFNLAFTNADSEDSAKVWFETNAISEKWYPITVAEKPPLKFCFSPHEDSDLSMTPVGDAINGAKSSVFFAIAFLYQTKSGPVRTAIDELMKSRVFSYGISDKPGKLQLFKPDKSIGLVDFKYLAKVTPKPFKSEWSGGSGIHQHDKFVVTNFNLPNATVFTGSSNLSPSGEEGNGDNLVMIKDERVATSYAIEALRIFDHLHFRVRMERGFSSRKETKKGGRTKRAKQARGELTLRKPEAISGNPAWFKEYYVPRSQKENDRKLFSRSKYVPK